MMYVVEPSMPCSTTTLCGSGSSSRSGAALSPLVPSAAEASIWWSVIPLRLHLHPGRDQRLDGERRLVEADQQHTVGAEVLHVAGDRVEDVLDVGLRVVGVLGRVQRDLEVVRLDPGRAQVGLNVLGQALAEASVAG